MPIKINGHNDSLKDGDYRSQSFEQVQEAVVQGKLEEAAKYLMEAPGVPGVLSVTKQITPKLIEDGKLSVAGDLVSAVEVMDVQREVDQLWTRHTLFDIGYRMMEKGGDELANAAHLFRKLVPMAGPHFGGEPNMQEVALGAYYWVKDAKNSGKPIAKRVVLQEAAAYLRDYPLFDNPAGQRDFLLKLSDEIGRNSKLANPIIGGFLAHHAATDKRAPAEIKRKPNVVTSAAREALIVLAEASPVVARAALRQTRSTDIPYTYRPQDRKLVIGLLTDIVEKQAPGTVAALDAEVVAEAQEKEHSRIQKVEAAKAKAKTDAARPRRPRGRPAQARKLAK